jgi:hypothetical protein
VKWLAEATFRIACTTDKRTRFTILYMKRFTALGAISEIIIKSMLVSRKK